MTNPLPSEHIIIIGGGVSGLSAASRLAQAGLPVVLLESASHLGFQASTRNQGWLHSGGFFARQDPQLARQFWEAQRTTMQFCPHCIEPDHDGMFYVASRVETVTSDWTAAWQAAGIPFLEVGRDRFLRDVPGVNANMIQRVFLLPDRAFRADVLVGELAASARNAGAELRIEAHVSKLLIRDGAVQGVVLGTGEEIGGGQVIASAGLLSESELLGDFHRQTPAQPTVQRVPIKAHLVAVRPDLTRMPFVVLDWHGFNHIPHVQTSVFHSGTWKLTHDPHDTQVEGQEISKLWQDIQTLFPAFDRTKSLETREWAGTTIQALTVEQINPADAVPRPAVIHHGDEGGPQNLWSICPGRASLWPHVAEELREKILSKHARQPLTPALPPWAVPGQ